jgi:hypothetical protein
MKDKNKIFKLNNYQYKSLKHKSLKHKSLKHKSLKHKSLKHKSLKHKSLKHKSLKHKSLKHKSLKKYYGGAFANAQDFSNQFDSQLAIYNQAVKKYLDGIKLIEVDGLSALDRDILLYKYYAENIESVDGEYRKLDMILRNQRLKEPQSELTKQMIKQFKTLRQINEYSRTSGKLAGQVRVAMQLKQRAQQVMKQREKKGRAKSAEEEESDTHDIHKLKELLKEGDRVGLMASEVTDVIYDSNNNEDLEESNRCLLRNRKTNYIMSCLCTNLLAPAQHYNIRTPTGLDAVSGAIKFSSGVGGENNIWCSLLSSVKIVSDWLSTLNTILAATVGRQGLRLQGYKLAANNTWTPTEKFAGQSQVTCYDKTDTETPRMSTFFLSTLMPDIPFSRSLKNTPELTMQLLLRTLKRTAILKTHGGIIAKPTLRYPPLFDWVKAAYDTADECLMNKSDLVKIHDTMKTNLPFLPILRRCNQTKRFYFGVSIQAALVGLGETIVREDSEIGGVIDKAALMQQIIQARTTQAAAAQPISLYEHPTVDFVSAAGGGINVYLEGPTVCVVMELQDYNIFEHSVNLVRSIVKVFSNDEIKIPDPDSATDPDEVSARSMILIKGHYVLQASVLGYIMREDRIRHIICVQASIAILKGCSNGHDTSTEGQKRLSAMNAVNFNSSRKILSNHLILAGISNISQGLVISCQSRKTKIKYFAWCGNTSTIVEDTETGYLRSDTYMARIFAESAAVPISPNFDELIYFLPHTSDAGQFQGIGSDERIGFGISCDPQSMLLNCPKNVTIYIPDPSTLLPPIQMEIGYLNRAGLAGVVDFDYTIQLGQETTGVGAGILTQSLPTVYEVKGTRGVGTPCIYELCHGAVTVIPITVSARPMKILKELAAKVPVDQKYTPRPKFANFMVDRNGIKCNYYVTCAVYNLALLLQENNVTTLDQFRNIVRGYFTDPNDPAPPEPPNFPNALFDYIDEIQTELEERTSRDEPYVVNEAEALHDGAEQKLLDKNLKYRFTYLAENHYLLNLIAQHSRVLIPATEVIIAPPPGPPGAPPPGAPQPGPPGAPPPLLGMGDEENGLDDPEGTPDPEGTANE